MIVKEHITPKQAEQLSKEEFYSLFSNLTDRRHWYRYHNTKMTVGKMIGILGEDLKGIDRIGCSYRVKVEDKEF